MSLIKRFRSFITEQPKNAHRTIFVNRFYAPDLSATAQILTDIAEALADRNHHVIVYSSRASYDGNAAYEASSTINNVIIRRIWSTNFGRESGWGRLIDYATFYVSISATLLFKLSRGDTLVVKTDPPILSIPLGLIARLKKAALVNWLQDVFPEVALELGVGKSTGVIANLLKSLRTRSLRLAYMNVVIGTRMFERLQELGVPKERITIIQNFVDDEAIKRSHSHAPELRKEWGLTDQDFVVGYSGNLGRAHDVDTMLDAAELLTEYKDIKFLFIGGGYQHTRLAKEICRRNLANLKLLPYQARERLNESLALPDLHWASLLPQLEGYIVPSKVYGIAAAGRPLLMVGDPSGEVARMLARVKFGKCVPIGDAEAAQAFILHARNDRADSIAMGHRAREFIDREASRRHAIRCWDDLLKRQSECDSQHFAFD